MWKWSKRPKPKIPEIRMEILAPTQQIPALQTPCQETRPTSRQDSSRSKPVEFRTQDQLELQPTSPVSPTPSTDRLSVSFGLFSTGGSSTRSSIGSSAKSMISSRESIPSDPRVRFSKDYVVSNPDDDDDDDDDEYNASLDALLQRRQSKRRSSTRRSPSRRMSSPFGSEMDRSRRRSSTMTITSGETQVSVEDEIPEEEIFENIRLHKEVLESVKTQAWRTRKKLKVARQAKTYIKKHEGLLEQRLAQSKSTKDIMARYKLIFFRHSARVHRELLNLASQMIPWENRIKRIECHFGSSVASYFTFLRWIFWVNLAISVLVACFIIIPEVLAADRIEAGDRKELLPSEKDSAFNLQTIWEFEGWLKYSPIFYGYYTNKDKTKAGYRLPFAYFMASIGMYAYSFWAILKKMAENSRTSKLSEKDEECTFTWKLFTGWDYMIGNSETSQNKVASLIMGFKEVVLEEQEKKKEGRNWKIISLRVLANFFVIILLVMSAYAVVKVVERTQQPDGESTWWRKNELTIVLNGITTLYPNLFEVIGLMENFHPRTQLQWQLSRIWILNMLNLYTLNFALFEKVEKMSANLTNLQPNITTTYPTITSSGTKFLNFTTPSQFGLPNSTLSTQNCTTYLVPCNETSPTPFNPPTFFDNVTITTPYFNDSVFGNLIPNFTDIINSSFELDTNISNAVIINGKVVVSADDSNWETNFVAHFHSGLQSLSLVYLPCPVREENNLSLTGCNVSTIANMTELSTITSSAVSGWLSTTVIPDLPTDKPILNLTLTTSFEIEEGNDIPTLTTPLVTSTLINVTEISNLTERLCEVEVCVDISEFTEPDVEDVSEKVTWPTDDLSTFCENCSDFASTEETTTLLMIGDYPVDMDTRIKLRKLCWETMFGQEIVKLTVMDLVFTCLMSLIMDFFRAVFVRVMNRCWCWDLEKQFPGYGDFKIAENILHLINNQGMIWMGTFFSPGLPAINTVKLVILVYVRSWAVLTCNVPHETVFRASRSNNFYYALLLTMLFLCTLPVSYAVIWIKPSWHCGPFSDYVRIYHILTLSIKRVMPDVVNRALDYLTSPSIVIPVMLLLALIIYYLLSLARSLREANKDLKNQLRRERTEERKKVFQMAEGGGQDGQPGGDMASKWPAVMKKILPVLPNKKSLPDVEKIALEDDDEKKKSPSHLILMSDDDIFIETENNAPLVSMTDETTKDKRSSKDSKNKKGTEVPVITISKVKDDEKSEKKKSKDKSNGKNTLKPKNDSDESDQTSLISDVDDKKKSKSDGKDKKEKKSKKEEKTKKEDKSSKKEEKSKKDEKVSKKDEKSSKKDEKSSKKDEKSSKKDEKLSKKDEKSSKKDEKSKKEDKSKKEKPKKEDKKSEKSKKDDKHKPDSNGKYKQDDDNLKRNVDIIDDNKLDDIRQSEEIELTTLPDKADIPKPEIETKLRNSQLKDNGSFEADTVPLVIEFSTPSSVGSIQSVPPRDYPDEQQSLSEEEECDVSDKTILVSNEQQIGRETPPKNGTLREDDKSQPEG